MQLGSDIQATNETLCVGGQEFGKMEPTTLLAHVFKVCALSSWEHAYITCSFIYLYCIIVVRRCAGVCMSHVMLLDVH